MWKYGEMSFSFMHGLTSKNTNEESPAAPSTDSKSFAPTATEMYHTLDGHDDLNEQMRMIDLTEEDLRLLRLMKPVVEQRIDDITNQFYNTVLGVNKLEAIILEHSSIERLKRLCASISSRFLMVMLTRST